MRFPLGSLSPYSFASSSSATSSLLSSSSSTSRFPFSGLIKLLWLPLFLIITTYPEASSSMSLGLVETSTESSSSPISLPLYREKWRPQYHFSPPTSWINDPNGLTYHQGKYHLFFQYHPGALVWGPMHWGHATSTDLLHWTNLPIAIYPDQSGAAFSGSAIVDHTNVTGLQQSASSGLIVAIFTRYIEDSPTPQTQHLAYSPDGENWTFYEHNPILVEPGRPDHRDPSILRYGDEYILSLAAGNSAMFYKSSNLIDWTLLSSFGDKPLQGSHGGVWECPALIPFEIEGRKLYVLLISINPGGPTVGSATQYFVGTFDGTRFVNKNPADRTLWLDWGPDNYAAALYTDTPRPKPTLIAWMNNWAYAPNETTTPWRGQMTLPRSMELIKIGDDDYHVATFPIDEVSSLRTSTLYTFNGEPTTKSLAIQHSSEHYHLEASINFNQSSFGTVLITLSNQATGEKVTMNLDNLRIEIDRSSSGVTDFSSDFTKLIRGSRIIPSSKLFVDLFFDSSTVELFYDKGLTSFSYVIFPNEPYDLISIECTDGAISTLNMYEMSSIWTSSDSISTDTTTEASS